MSVQTAQAAAATLAVLDTNVALDWLVFRDARVQPLVAALQGGALRPIACARTRTELAHMLAHRSLARWAPDPGAALGQFDRLVLMLSDPPPAPGHAGLRCVDTDDQVFVDLALAHRARWLFTQDRALLQLARRAMPHGLVILTPQRWVGAPDRTAP